MYKKLFFLFIIYIFSSVLVFAEPIGFRGLNWGTYIDKSQFNCETFDDDKNSAICHKKNENLTIGGVELKSIAYFLYKDVLESVIINVDGYNNSQQVFKSFQFNYGEGYPKYKNCYSFDDWQWNLNNVFITYTYNTYKDQSSFAILSKKMYYLKKKDSENAIKNSTKDF